MDLFNNINVKRAISPPASPITDNTVLSTISCDMADLECAVLAILTGTLADADATFTITAKESDTNAFGGEETDVAAADMLGTLALAGFTFANDDSLFKIGFRASGKRYKLVKITPANNAGSAPIAAVWIRLPRQKPTANPPS